jgi:dipeptidase E
MKLYLSSFREGDHPEKLQALVGQNKRAAVIMNAVDHQPNDVREERRILEFETMRRLGFDPEEVDLRDYFENNDALKAILLKYGLLWIRGGNVFILRKAMRLSGFESIIRILLDSGIVYAGYSAGSCAAGPNLHGIELCDDVTIVPRGYPVEIIWEGLGLIDYEIAPHYKSNHPESPMIDDVVAYFEKHNVPYKPLRDGEAIVINDGH